MPFSILLVLFCFLITGRVAAEEAGENPSVENVKETDTDGSLENASTLAQMSYPLASGKGELLVVVRSTDTGSEASQVLLELRPRCGDRKVSVRDLEAQTVRRVCGIDLESFSLDASQSLLTVQLTPKCQGEREVASFDINQYCP